MWCVTELMACAALQLLPESGSWGRPGRTKWRLRLYVPLPADTVILRSTARLADRVPCYLNALMRSTDDFASKSSSTSRFIGHSYHLSPRRARWHHHGSSPPPQLAEDQTCVLVICGPRCFTSAAWAPSNQRSEFRHESAPAARVQRCQWLPSMAATAA